MAVGRMLHKRWEMLSRWSCHRQVGDSVFAVNGREWT